MTFKAAVMINELIEAYGDRCPPPGDPGCATCRAWKLWDNNEIAQLRADIDEVNEWVAEGNDMTTWNHRMVRTTDDNETLVRLVEVHYRNDVPIGYSEPFMMGEDEDGCRLLVKRLALATEAPTLNYPADFDLKAGRYKEEDAS